MLRLALTHHGYSVPSEQTSDPFTSSPSTPPRSRIERPQNTIGFNSNGLDDFPPLECLSAANPEPPETPERGNGVYL